MRRRLGPLACVLALCGGNAAGQTLPLLELPAPAAETGRDTEARSLVRLPTGPWTAGGPPALALEGAVTRKAYRVGRGALTVAQVLAPAWETLAAAGFEEVYTCRAADCGGFDFRFALDILGAPAMHVDLGDYVYRLGRRGEEAVALVASRSAAAGFLHVTHVVPGAGAPPAGPVAEAAGDTALELPPAVSSRTGGMPFSTGWTSPRDRMRWEAVATRRSAGSRPGWRPIRRGGSRSSGTPTRWASSRRTSRSAARGRRRWPAD